MCVCVGGGGGGGYSNMELVYICLKMGGGLKERPLTENAGRGGGCFQRGPSREKHGIWELKITKKRIFF